jgi:hypothetical protein
LYLIRQSFGSFSGALRLPPKASRSPVEAVTNLLGICLEADSNPSRRPVEQQSKPSRSGLEGIEHFPEQKEEKMRFKVDYMNKM